MPGTRKRKSRAGNGDGAASDQKRCKIALPGSARENIIKSALLAQFYPKVLTLREYLLHKLPQHSKVRKRKIRNVGKGDSVDGEFATFLDQTLVGIRQAEAPSSDERLKSWNAFSQRNDESISTLANLTGVGRFSQSEVRNMISNILGQEVSLTQLSGCRLYHLATLFQMQQHQRQTEPPAVSRLSPRYQS